MRFLADNSDIVSVSAEVLRPNSARTVVRPFVPGDPEEYADPSHPRPQRIVDRVQALSEDEVQAVLDRMIKVAGGRPRNIVSYLLDHFERLDGRVIDPGPISMERKLLMAAYFSAEYSFEAAALFNPSMIPHPEGSDLRGGGVRFLISLRGVGEGHVSSVTFRTGSWSAMDGFKIDDAGAQGIMLRAAGTEGEGEETITH